MNCSGTVDASCLPTTTRVHPRHHPSADSETEAYLNRPDVQKALHANVSGELPGPWQDCTSRITYSRQGAEHGEGAPERGAAHP